MFIAKGLDNGLTAHHLIDQRGLSAAHFTLLLEQTIRTAGDKAGDKKAQRGQHNDHQGNPEIFGEHENQRHQNRHDAGKQLGKSEQQSVRQHIGIGDDAADNVARAVLVQIRERQLLNVPNGARTNVLHDMIGHAVVEQIHEPCAQRGSGSHQENQTQIAPHLYKVHAMRGDGLVNGIAEQNRNIQLQNNRSRREDNTQSKCKTMCFHVGKQLTERSGCGVFVLLFHASSRSFLDSSGNWDS